MTTEAKAPTAFQRAEGGSRQLVLQIGLGTLSFVLGGLFTAGASVRLAERVGYIENEAIAFAVGWLLQRLWLFVVLPMFGWGIGRLTKVPPLRFAIVSAVAGEVFSVLLFTGINGFEVFADVPLLIVVRLVTLFFGMAIIVSAVQAGRRAALVAQAEADEVARQRKAEYAEYLAKQEGRDTTPPAESGARSD